MKEEIPENNHRFLSAAALLTGVILVCAAVFGDTGEAYAAVTSAPSSVQVSSMSSSKANTKERFRVRTPLSKKHVIYIEGKTKVPTKLYCIRLTRHHTSSYAITVFVRPTSGGRFSIRINTKKGNRHYPSVIARKGKVIRTRQSTRPGAHAVGTIRPGKYELTIARAKTKKDADVTRKNWYKGTLGGRKGYACKEFVLSVKKGHNNDPKLISYPSAVKNNESFRTRKVTEEQMEEYRDPMIRDIPLFFGNPETGGHDYMTKAQAAYIKSVADKVTAGATSKYQKLLKIYQYTASHFYYDTYAHEQKANQYANPYLNIYHQRHKSNSANSQNGKVATVCHGFSAIEIAMARAEGIPARLAYGNHIHKVSTIWEDRKGANVSTRNHWWAEAYVGGRWVILDADAGSNSTWNRNSFHSKGTWTYSGINSYMYFDPTPELMAMSYLYLGYYD